MISSCNKIQLGDLRAIFKMAWRSHPFIDVPLK